MTRTLIVIAAFLTLSVPAALAVPPADKGKPEKPGKSQSAPGQSAEKNAAKKCKAERENDRGRGVQDGTHGEQGERVRQVRLGARRRRPRTTRTTRPSRRRTRTRPRSARRERETRSGLETFKTKYGTNANKANAFGKCVSKLAKKTTS